MIGVSMDLQRCEGALLAFTSIDLSKNAFFENICSSSPAENSFIND